MDKQKIKKEVMKFYDDRFERLSFFSKLFSNIEGLRRAISECVDNTLEVVEGEIRGRLNK